MSIPDRFSDSTPATRRPSFARRAIKWLAASLLGRAVCLLVAALVERRRIRVAIDILQRWDDRSLRDIGVHRMGIERMVRTDADPHAGEADGRPELDRSAAGESDFAESSEFSRTAPGGAPSEPDSPAANDNGSAEHASGPPGVAADRR